MTFTDAYIRYYPYVYKICKSFFEDKAKIEDATQETMFKLMQKWDTLDKKESLNAWLATTARNTCKDIFRKQNREILLEEIPETEFPEEDPGKLLLEEAKEIVKNFPAIYREIFHLSFVCDYTGQQIADLLRIPLSTVKTRTRICIQKLKAVIE